MLPLLRRWAFYTIGATIILLAVLQLDQVLQQHVPALRSRPKTPIERLTHPGFFGKKFSWRNVPQRHPVENLTSLPCGPLVDIPRIQHEFGNESAEHHRLGEERLSAIKQAFVHSWEGYKKNAWLQDEVAPLTGQPHNGLGGWGATLVDSLDTLWIMGLHKEFAVAVAELRKIDFTTSSMTELNVFETTIRYLGGLLSAYDVSGHKYAILLEKATQLGDMLYVAFDTPNRMPVTRWDWKNGALGGPQEAARFSLLAEVGSLTLEFTRLSQLTGDDKWYDAVARVTDVFEQQQNRTKIPGLFATMLDTKNADFTRDNTFTLGGMADSVYEYLPKQHLMLGGRSEQYRNLYLTALESAKRHIFFRPLNPQNQDLLISGAVKRHSSVRSNHVPEGEHLTCFAGGMVALAAKIFQQSHDIEVARQLVDGCLWAYESMPSGIMPEIFRAAPCTTGDGEEHGCQWTDQKWYNAITTNGADEAQTIIMDKNLPPGFTDIKDPRYQLRPEAIESLFVVYRITGDESLREKAWQMFQAIDAMARTKIGYAGIQDVNFGPEDEGVRLIDTMESFWTGETLKYFYLIFSDPDVISLDEYVLQVLETCLSSLSDADNVPAIPKRIHCYAQSRAATSPQYDRDR
jgi:mannosyl-oligosaccharide alpha-1,2-mannosidase